MPTWALSGWSALCVTTRSRTINERSNAWQDSSRRFSADSLQKLRDRVGQRSAAVRAQRSTVVNTVAQGESVAAVSEVVANYNRCHAMTVEYFEVLRHFLITHELSDVDECMFVPFFGGVRRNTRTASFN